MNFPAPSRRSLLVSGGAMTTLLATSVATAPAASADAASQSQLFNVFDYYGAPTGSVAQNDTNAWKACLAAANAAIGYGGGGSTAKTHPVVTAPGGSFKINDTLEWDIRVTIEGHCEIESVITDNSKPLWKAVCVNQADAMWLSRNRASSFSHVINRGSGRGSRGMLLAFPAPGAGVFKTAQITFRNTAWVTFGCAFEFGDRTYMIGFHSTSIQRNQLGLLVPTNAEDTGERIVFEDCDITGNVEAFNIGKGVGLHFIACSFDQFEDGRAIPYGKTADADAIDPMIGTLNNGYVVLEACHLEGYVPHAQTGTVASATARPWFDLKGAFVDLRISNSLFRMKARDDFDDEVVNAGPPFIQFADDPDKVQRAVISGGHFSSSDESLAYLSAGLGGTLTVKDTAMDASARFWPHVQREKGLVVDPTPTGSVVLDDWIFSSVNASIAVVDDGGSKAYEITQSVKESSLAQLFLPIRQHARFRISFQWKNMQVGNVIARTHYGTSKKIINPTKYAEDTLAYGAGDWVYANMPQMMRQPAPSWATYAVLSLSLSALPAGGKIRLRAVEASQQ